jgi:hypothetical protein
MRTIRTIGCLVLLWLAWSPRLEAAPQVSFFGRTVRPLLYVTSAESADFGANWSERQVYIFRDGTVLVAALGERSGEALPTGGGVLSGKASPERMRDLAEALAHLKVSSTADCSIDPPDAPLEWFFKFTWFGAGDRTNTFKATQDAGTRCPREVEDLISAVQLVINSASSAAGTRLFAP